MYTSQPDPKGRLSFLARSFTTMPNKPHREVYTVIANAGADKKSRWVKIGATFLNRDGSESVFLDALPTNGKLQLRSPKAKGASEEQS